MKRALARLLLDDGADVNATNNDGNTALDLARANGAQEMVGLLESCGGRSGESH